MTNRKEYISMEYRQLGPAGVRVSVIGLGTNRFGDKVLPQERGQTG